MSLKVVDALKAANRNVVYLEASGSLKTSAGDEHFVVEVYIEGVECLDTLLELFDAFAADCETGRIRFRLGTFDERWFGYFNEAREDALNRTE